MTNEPIKENPGQEGITTQAPAVQDNTREAITAQPRETIPGEGAPPAAEDAAGPVPPVKVPTYEGFDRVLAFLLLVLAFFLGSFAVSNSDVLMHLATGRRIAQGEYQFGVDPYRFTVSGAESQTATWVNHSWFYSLLLYGLFTLGGEMGLVIARGLLAAGIALLLLSTRDRRLPLLLSIFFVGLGMLGMSQLFALRPMMVSMLLFAVTLHLLYRAGVLGGIEPGRERPRLLWGVPLVCLFWVNMDAWFIMGPLLVGLVWAGHGLNGLFGATGPVRGKDLGLVFAVSLLACLMNPHTYQAFQLPSEMAHGLLRLGFPVPEGMGAGGYTLQELQGLQERQKLPGPGNLWTPLDSVYRSNSNLGGNIAGWSFLVLLVMGLATFIFMGLARGENSGGGMDLARLVPWFILSFLALFVGITLIPWAAILGSLVAMLNLGDFLRQRQEAAAARKTAPLEPGLGRLARLASFLFFLIALVMAWPGWLHSSTTNFSSPRRVDWTFQLDSSQIALAQRLGDLQGRGKAQNVFNFDPSLADYCAWYAPGVRCFVDHRYPLLSKKTLQDHASWKDSLWEESKQVAGWEPHDPEAEPGSKWRKGFLKAKVDHVALLPLERDPRTLVILQRMWLETQEWTLRFGEGQVALLAWAGGTGQKPEEDFLEQRAAEIFRGLPAEKRPPAGGLENPGLPDTWDLYARGRDRNRGDKWDGYFLARLFHAPWINLPGKSPVPAQLELPFLMANVSNFILIPGDFSGIGTAMGIQSMRLTFDGLMTQSRFSGRPMLVRPPDYGHAAIPLMLVQDARRHLGPSPASPSLLFSLAQAYMILENNQEDYWADFVGVRIFDLLTTDQAFLALGARKKEGTKETYWDRELVLANLKWTGDGEIQLRRKMENVFNRRFGLHPPGGFPKMRKQLRLMQIGAFYKMAADHMPDNLNIQLILGNHYRSQHFLDAALKQFQRARDLMEDIPGGKRLKEYKGIQGEIGYLEALLKGRVDRAISTIAGVQEGPQRWSSIYQICMDMHHEFKDGDMMRLDPFGMGLPLTCLEQLQNYPVGSLPEEEKQTFICLQLELMLRLGLVREVADILNENFKHAQGHHFSRIHALVAAVLGDYGAAQKHLADLETMNGFLPPWDLEPFRKERDQLRKDWTRAGVVAPMNFLLSLPDGPPSFGWAHLLPHFSSLDQQLGQKLNEIAAIQSAWVEWYVYRGILALEAGDATQARDHFHEAVAMANLPRGGENRIPELMIAVRYLDWMERYEKK